MHSNINNESYQSLKKFRENQIKTNIKLHLVFILLVLIIDIGFLSFIFVYKNKLSSLKSKSTQNTSLINTNKDLLETNNNLIAHKVINIVAQMPDLTYRFSLIFQTSDQVQKIKNSIKDFYKDTKNMNLDTNKFSMDFVYSAVMDGGEYKDMDFKITTSHNTFIIFEAENENKFGFYVEQPVIFSNKKEFPYSGNNCFLISFQHDGIYKCIGDKIKLSIKDKEKMIVIGDDDIIIKKNFFNYEDKKGIINFPFKAFDVSTINKNIFTNNDENLFHIMGIEVFSFYLN